MFPTDDAVIKAVYLAIQNVCKIWTQPIQNWAIIASQFLIIYPTRCNIIFYPAHTLFGCNLVNGGMYRE